MECVFPGDLHIRSRDKFVNKFDVSRLPICNINLCNIYRSYLTLWKLVFILFSASLRVVQTGEINVDFPFSFIVFIFMKTF